MIGGGGINTFNEKRNNFMAISAKTGSIINSDIDRFVTREETFRYVVCANNVYIAIPPSNGQINYDILVSRNGIDWVEHSIKIGNQYNISYCNLISHNNTIYLYATYDIGSKNGLFRLDVSDINNVNLFELISTSAPSPSSQRDYKIFNNTLYFAIEDVGIYKVTPNKAEQIISGDCYRRSNPSNFKTWLNFFIVDNNAIILESISDSDIDALSNSNVHIPCFLKISTVTPNGMVYVIDWSVLLGPEYTNYFDPNNHTLLRTLFNFGLPVNWQFSLHLAPYSTDVFNVHGSTIAFASHAKDINNDSYATAKSVFIFSNDSGLTWKTVPMSNFDETGIISEYYFTSSVNFIYDDAYVEFCDRNGNRGVATAHSMYPGNVNLDSNIWTRGNSFYPVTLWKSYDGFFYGLDPRLNLYRYKKSGVNQAVPSQITIDSFVYTSWNFDLTNDYPVIYLQNNLVFIVDYSGNLWYSSNNANFIKIDHKFSSSDVKMLKDQLCVGPMVLVHTSGHIALR